MRRALLIMFVLLMLLPGSLLLAQGDTETTAFCGELSEADCALFNTASDELPMSTAFESALSFRVAGGGEDVAFGVTATGGYVIDMSQQTDAVAGIADTTLLDFAVSDALTLIEGGINTFDGELLITITPSAGAVPPMFEEIPLNLWLVDGTGYVDLSPAAIMDPMFDGVFGMNLMEAIRYGLSQVTVGDIADGMSGMGMDGDFADAFSDEDSPFNQALQNQVQLTEAEGRAFLDEITTLSRLEDTEIDGAAVAVLEISVDTVALFESDVFKRGFELNTADQDLPFTADAFSAAMTGAFAEAPVTDILVYIGAENRIFYGFEVVTDYQVDVDALAAAFGEETGEEPIGVVTAATTFSFLRSQVNILERIDLPEGATVITIEELITMMSGAEDA